MPDGGQVHPWPPVPAQARVLGDALGPEGLLRLIEKRGGTSVRLGATAKPSRKMAEQLGLDVASVKRLREVFGEQRIKVPLLRHWRARIYKLQGLSYAEIALRLGVTDSTVWTYLRDAQMTGAQMQLPLNV